MSREQDARVLWTLHPKLAAFFLLACEKFPAAFPGCRAGVSSAYRPPSAQAAANAGGRSPFNGLTAFSKHQALPSLALDLAVFDEAGKYLTDGSDKRYAWLGDQAEQAGLLWGGKFTHPRSDPDHVEQPGAGPTAAEVTGAARDWRAVTTSAPFLR